jgi:NAD(P)H-nitrite reductase large subunit
MDKGQWIIDNGSLSIVHYPWSIIRMELDDELCLCFHVSKRKVVNYLRVEKPRREGQLAECFGAGTGCGWCRPFLQRLFDQAQANDETPAELPTAADYAKERSRYVRAGGGTPPPGATPVEEV